MNNIKEADTEGFNILQELKSIQLGVSQVYLEQIQYVGYCKMGKSFFHLRIVDEVTS